MYDKVKNRINDDYELINFDGTNLYFAHLLQLFPVLENKIREFGAYCSFDVEFQINHLVTGAIVLAAYWLAISPVLYQLLAKSKTAAIGAMSLLAPIIKLAYV